MPQLERSDSSPPNSLGPFFPPQPPGITLVFFWRGTPGSESAAIVPHSPLYPLPRHSTGWWLRNRGHVELNHTACMTGHSPVSAQVNAQRSQQSPGPMAAHPQRTGRPWDPRVAPYTLPGKEFPQGPHPGTASRPCCPDPDPQPSSHSKTPCRLDEPGAELRTCFASFRPTDSFSSSKEAGFFFF